MTVEEAEKILGIERNMSYEEVLRVRVALSCFPLLGMVVAVFGEPLVQYSQSIAVPLSVPCYTIPTGPL